MNKSVIEMHATWLTINSIVGCTNGCKYCFFQTTNENLKPPRIIVTAEEAIKKLIESKYYNESIPICLLPNTDPFLNKTNIEYLKELLYLIKQKQLSNTFTIVTKCSIEEDFIKYVKKLKMDNQLIFYLSFSGLGKNIEKNIDIEKIKRNFEILHKNNLKIIHYFRPLIPENSSKEKIDEILDFVSKYTDCSVITGLKIKEEYFDKIDFWKDIKEHKEECIRAEGVWVKSAFEYFYKNYKRNHQIFQTNSCALATKIKIPRIEYYNSNECCNYNICSDSQREKCKKCAKNISIKDLKNQIIIQLKKLDKYNEDVIINIGNPTILENVKLEVGDLAYLTYMCHTKIIIKNKDSDDRYFNSSLNGSKPLILEG